MKKVVFVSNLQENLYEKLLVQELKTQKFEVNSITSDHYIFLPKIFQWGNLDILHLHDVIHIFLAADNQLKRWVKFFLFLLQLFIVRLLRIKVIWTIHEWSDKTGGKWGEIYPSWLKTISLLLNGIISHSQSTMDVAIRELDSQSKKPNAVIMHGNYIRAYKNSISQAEARKKLAIPQEHFVFLLFGNILRSKGVLDAISSFKGINHGNCSLLIVGFPGEAGIESIISEQIKDLKNIVFIPQKIPDDDIQLYMNACDCVLLPYKVFTTSGVAILAMSFSKACLVPEIGYFAEILDHQGAFLYGPEEELGLKHAMQVAIESKVLTPGMGRHNYDVATQWSWDYVAGETAKLYMAALNMNT